MIRVVFLASLMAVITLARPTLRAQEQPQPVAQPTEFLFEGDRPVFHVQQRDDPAAGKIYVLVHADGKYWQSDDDDVLHVANASKPEGPLVLTQRGGQGTKFEFASSRIQTSIVTAGGRQRTGFQAKDQVAHFEFDGAPVELAETLGFVTSPEATPTQVSGGGAVAKPAKAKPSNVRASMSMDHDLSKPREGPGQPAAVKAVLEDPETLNHLLKSQIESTSGLRFLKDVEWEFKTFDSGDGDPALGVTYDYQGQSNAKSISGDNGHLWTAVSFSANGNIAFGNQLNPSDFLNTSFSLDFFGSWGGFYRAPKEKNTGGLAWDAKDDDALRWFNANPEFQKFSNDVIAAGQYTSIEELDQSEEWRTVYAFIQKRTSTQYYVDASLHAALESNQTFTQRNSVIGGHLGLEVKAYNRDSAWATANFFDYPFAVLRWLTGYDKEFAVRGSNWPSVLLSLDRVAPEGDDPREQAGDTSDYDRVRAEVSFTAPVGRYDGSDVKFTANYRYYHELDASSAVKGAELDSYDYAALTMSTEQGLFISYATGHLPFNDGDQNYIELGFKTQL